LAARIAQFEVRARAVDFAIGVLVMADANEDLRFAAPEPGPGLERGRGAAHGAVGRDLTPSAGEPVDQPVMKCRRVEQIDLGPATNLDLRVEAAVGRSGESRGRVQAQERSGGPFAIDGSAAGTGLWRSVLHGVTRAGAVSECDRVEDELLRFGSNRRAWELTGRVVST